MKTLAIVAVLLLSACRVEQDKPMTNDEIVAEIKKCEAADLNSALFSQGLDYKTYRIECRPRGQK